MTQNECSQFFCSKTNYKEKMWRTWKNPKSHEWKDGREILTSDEWNEMGSGTYKNDQNFKPNYVIQNDISFIKHFYTSICFYSILPLY